MKCELTNESGVAFKYIISRMKLLFVHSSDFDHNILSGNRMSSGLQLAIAFRYFTIFSSYKPKSTKKSDLTTLSILLNTDFHNINIQFQNKTVLNAIKHDERSSSKDEVLFRKYFQLCHFETKNYI